LPGEPAPVVNLMTLGSEALRCQFGESDLWNTGREAVQAAIRAQPGRLT